MRYCGVRGRSWVVGKLIARVPTRGQLLLCPLRGPTVPCHRYVTMSTTISFTRMQRLCEGRQDQIYKALECAILEKQSIEKCSIQQYKGLTCLTHRAFAPSCPHQQPPVPITTTKTTPRELLGKYPRRNHYCGVSRGLLGQ